jgi:hypothetical protein
VQHRGWLFIEAVSDLISETLADLSPKLDEGFTCFDVDSLRRKPRRRGRCTEAALAPAGDARAATVQLASVRE